MTRIDYTKSDEDPTGKRPGSWLHTFTGRQFFPLDIRAEDIVIEDIAHALSMLCRYNGHTSRFYSVAEHCVLMAQHVQRSWHPPAPKVFIRTVLLHDAAEAYIGDYPHAVKKILPGVKVLEKKIEAVIAKKFGLDCRPAAFRAVKELDRRIVRNERDVLMPGGHTWVADEYPPLSINVQGLVPAAAERLFLSAFFEVEGHG